MYKKFSYLLVAGLLLCRYAGAQSKEVEAVAAAGENLRLAMISGDSAALASLVWPQLTYGHSGGHVDDAREFVTKIASGKSDFVTIDISKQQIHVVNSTAIMRHHLHATTNDNGKPGEVSLDILLVWEKQKKTWKLLARQAVKAK